MRRVVPLAMRSWTRGDLDFGFGDGTGEVGDAMPLVLQSLLQLARCSSISRAFSSVPSVYRSGTAAC
jgi:hypothetical protein